MRVLAAFDKFKGSLSAPTACDIASGAIAAARGWTVDPCPLTDGGEGFTDILARSAAGQEARFTVAGPRGGEVTASVGMVSINQIPKAARVRLGGAGFREGGTIAVIEMAAASGLSLIAPAMRDPLHASSVGTGQLIRAAAGAGADAILLGVGGSATHDLGLGALGALGIGFSTASGAVLDNLVPADWPKVGRIEGFVADTLPPILIACDVDNPLLGPRGAVAVYGAQKGLVAGDAAALEAGSARMASLMCRHFGKEESLASAPGAGAAGGIAFGLMVAASADLLAGFELVASWIDLEARLRAADIVITGEGQFDDSSLSGKGPGTLILRALDLGKPVHVFAGRVLVSREIPGLTVHAVTPDGMALDAAMAAAPALLFGAVQRAFREG